MKWRGHSLRLLTSALQGHLPEQGDWFALLEIANRGWLTPALYVALERYGCLPEIPDEVRDYVALIHDRNLERNRRLRMQLMQALGALNSAGIEPVLLKGAITLFCGDARSVRSRMISDIDLNIAPAEMSHAKSALSVLGYRETGNARELARPQDAGVIELHGVPNRRSARYLTGDLGASAPVVEREGVKARIPSATAHAIHLIVHDMIKEGDYWRLRINLRHLHDLALLARSGDGIDWHRAASTLSDHSGRGALAMQLRALGELFGVDTPSQLRGGLVDKLKHEARLLAAGRDLNGSALRFVGKLLWGFRRFIESDARLYDRGVLGRVHSRLVSPSKGSAL